MPTSPVEVYVSKSSGGQVSEDKPLTKSERKAAAREQAKLLREEQKKRDRRRKTIIKASVAVGIVVVLAIIAIVVSSVVRSSKEADEAVKNAPSPANMIANGVQIDQSGVLTSPARKANSAPVAPSAPSSKSVVSVQVWNDFMCSACNAFESAYGQQLTSLTNSGKIKLTLHPISMLDSSSTTKYSTRSANAAAAVANYDPNAYWKFHQLLYTNYPGEGTAGLSDAKLKSLAAQAIGKADSSVNTAIDKGTFNTWVADASSRVLDKNELPGTDIKKFQGTPTIVINGKQFTGNFTDAAALNKAITAARTEATK